MSVVVDHDGHRELVAKGAPEEILRRCNRFAVEEETLDVEDLFPRQPERRGGLFDLRDPLFSDVGSNNSGVFDHRNHRRHRHNGHRAICPSLITDQRSAQQDLSATLGSVVP